MARFADDGSPALRFARGKGAAYEAGRPCPTIAAQPPTLAALARSHCAVLLVPGALLAAALVVSQAAGLGAVARRALCGAAHLLSVAWLFAVLVARLRGVALRLGERLPDVLMCCAEHARLHMSGDRLVRYVQSCVHNASAAAPAHCRYEHAADAAEPDPLGFLRGELAGWGVAADGHVVVDPSGIIVWANAALHGHFCYPNGELVEQNVRVLMPYPYCQEHDSILRRYDRGGRTRIVGKSRHVPVVDKTGHQFTVLLSVDERCDPDNEHNFVFVGRMQFADEAADEALDPAAVIQRHLDAGAADVAECCRGLEHSADATVVIDARGVIQYANGAATLMLGYEDGELPGNNVACLMPDEHARQHDAYLARYLRKLEAARAAGQAADSPVVDSATRDLFCRKKAGGLVRIYLSVKRVERPGGATADCLFVGKLLLSQDRAAVPRRSSRLLVATGACAAQVSTLTVRRCTVVAIAVHALSAADAVFTEGLQADYQTLMDLVMGLYPRFKAALQLPAGDCVYVTLNLHAPNAAHIDSAGGFLSEFLATWKAAKLRGGARLYTAAASGQCAMRTFGRCPYLHTDAYDMCGALLRVAAEGRVARALIDPSLHGELQYAFHCRPVNVMTLRRTSGGRRPGEIRIHELCALKDVLEDEWMYQIASQRALDPLVTWNECWQALHGAAGLARADYPAALGHLDRYVAENPGDETAAWLWSVVKQRTRTRPVPVARESSGALEYDLHYHLEPDARPGRGSLEPDARPGRGSLGALLLAASTDSLY